MYRPSFKFHRSKKPAKKIREEFLGTKGGESAGAGARKSQTEGNVLKKKGNLDIGRQFPTCGR